MARTTPDQGSERGSQQAFPDGDSRTDSAASATTVAPASYEAALGELERLVAAMEAGQMPLDHMLDGYRRGAVLLTYCRERLAAVEQQVHVVEAGALKPWVSA